MRANVSLLAQDYDGTIRSYEENVGRGGPVGPPALAWAAAAYWTLGRREDAERTAVQLTTRFPAFRLGTWNFFKLLKLPEDRQRLHDLMRAAGIPE
jgi:hypothetical protein